MSRTHGGGVPIAEVPVFASLERRITGRAEVAL
jgi:hypothetical protein